MGAVREAVTSERPSSLKVRLESIKDELERLALIKEEDVVREGPRERDRNKRAVKILKEALDRLKELQNGLNGY